MDTNTDPVRAHDELRVQAALLRTPEFLAQFDPDKFAGQIERVAAALARQPAAVDEERMKRHIAAQEAEIDALRTRLEDTVRDSTNEIEALRAEVERLRADRDSWKQQASDRVADWHAEHLRAERLAEAVRELVDVFSESGMYDEELFDKARAALAKENSND